MVISQNRPFRLSSSQFSMIMVLILLTLEVGCMKTQSLEAEVEHFPKHWPGDIFGAMSRLDELRENGNREMHSKATSIETEFVDLVEWLPQLIADSDLTENDFNQVESWVQLYVVKARALKEQGGDLLELRRILNVDALLDQLSIRCEQERRRLEGLEN